MSVSKVDVTKEVIRRMCLTVLHYPGNHPEGYSNKVATYGFRKGLPVCFRVSSNFIKELCEKNSNQSQDHFVVLLKSQNNKIVHSVITNKNKTIVSDIVEKTHFENNIYRCNVQLDGAKVVADISVLDMCSLITADSFEDNYEKLKKHNIFPPI